MSLQLHNTSELIDPETFKLKLLIYAISGVGKTTFLGTVPNICVAACETGYGNGLLTIAELGVPYILPATYEEFQMVCAGTAPKELAQFEALGLDSLSDMNKTFIKDYALKIPRSKGESQKRAAGIPEIDDYGTMGEVTRRLLRQLIQQPRHIIVTATLRIDKPDPESGQAAMLIGPDLPGQMFLGSPAMFDAVLCLKLKKVYVDPHDPKKGTRTGRFFASEGDSVYVLKNRMTTERKSILPAEFEFNLTTGEGTFPWILNKIKEAYKQVKEKK